MINTLTLHLVSNSKILILVRNIPEQINSIISSVENRKSAIKKQYEVLLLYS